MLNLHYFSLFQIAVVTFLPFKLQITDTKVFYKFPIGEFALIPSRISSETPSAPLGDVTSLYRSTTGPCNILGRHYSP